MTLSPLQAMAEAQALLDRPERLQPAGEDALPLAWALKELCYEAWRSDPPAAARAADVLQAVLALGVPPKQAREVEALGAWTEGMACLTRGQMAQAVSCFDLSAAAFRDAGRADPAAQTQVPKIMALSLLGQHEQAAACAEQAQRELLALGNLGAAAKVSQNLGVLQFRRDAYTEAARHHREAAVLFARQGDHHHSVLADIGLADTRAAMGDFDEALRIYARARMRAGSRALEPLLALIDESQALVELARGNYREALAGLESARRRYEALAMPQLLAVAEKQLADAYLELRLLPEAQALFEAAVAKFSALALPDEQAWALTQLGRCQALRGQSAASQSLADAQALFAAQSHSVGVAAVSLARAELALAKAQPVAALALAEDAASAYAQVEQAEGRARAEVLRGESLLQLGRTAQAQAVFDSTLATAVSLGQLQVRRRCLSGQGQIAWMAGDTERATAIFEAAIELFEDQRRALPADELRSAFLTEQLRPYEQRLAIALAKGRGEEVLCMLDRFRARALDERLAEGAAGAAQDPKDTAGRERLNWLYRRLRRLQDEGEPFATLEDEMRRLEHDLLERSRRRRLAAPASSSAVAIEFSVAALQSALLSGDALVEYGVLDDELFACVARPGSVTLFRRMAAWPEVLDALRAMHFQIESLRHGAAGLHVHLERLNERLQRRLARLQELVWTPLLAALAGCDRILLVPHGPLAGLPFAALPLVGDPLSPPLQLAMAPSARAALRGLERQPLPARRLVALAESSRLPHAGREVRQIATLFGQSQVLVDEQATLPALQSVAASADVLHLACHAQFRGDNPRFSALHLHDGALTVDRAEALALKPCTVVLSACESGIGESSSGDERVGLVRAFLVAGAARVLASLWPVDDEITAAFMIQFHTALVRGESPAAALAVAQQALRREHPHPAFWAAFALHGGW